MARKKTGSIEDLLYITSLLPWWAGLGLAIVAYLFLHNIASSEVALPVKTGQMGEYAARHLYKSAATFAQYVLPAILLLGAVGSVWRRSKRRQLIANVTQSPSANALDGMTWQEFEILIGEAFRQQGFAVTETGGGGADGGVDLVLAKNGEKFLVQCKQWKAFKVGVSVVRELYGVMAAKGVAGGYVVTSGQFTAEAKEFAAGRNIVLLDGGALRWLMGGVMKADVVMREQIGPPECPNRC